MSITVEKLSLLDSLAPLRHTAAGTSSPPHNSFAEKLDKVLGGGEPAAPGVAEKTRELAESLTLQMLQSSLSLAGDPSQEQHVVTDSMPFSAAKALQQAYLANTGDAVQNGPSSRPVVSQLHDLATSDAPVSETAPRHPSGKDPSWLDPIIAKASSTYGIDAGLIKAVIKAESNFNPQAVSHAGARGLMQLMPATARSLGVSDSFDPEQNVMGGTRFLKDMLQRYNGSVDSALAAYNWGPGNVDRYPGRLPHETREYLVRVKQLHESYSS